MANNNKKPIYLNWKLWVVLLAAFLLTLTGITLALWPDGLAAIGALMGTAATAVIAWAWDKIKSEFKEFRERLKDNEEKAVSASKKNAEIEKTAKQAASVATALSERVEVNAERSSLLETSNEALSKQYTTLNQSYAEIAKMARDLADNLQQERTESKLVTAQLKQQLEEVIKQDRARQLEIAELKENHRREIAELKENHRREIADLRNQIAKMGLEKNDDKEQIILLQGRVQELETKLGLLEAENEHLVKENRELKNTRMARHSTGQLPKILPAVQKEYNELKGAD